MHVRTEQRKTCRDCITLNFSVCVYRNETKLCTQVAWGNILTITECFSEFNSYNACSDVIDDEKSNLKACSFKKCSVIAPGLLREAYWPSLKAYLGSIWKEFSFLCTVFMQEHKRYVKHACIEIVHASWGAQDLSLASCCMKISLVVFKIANPSNGVCGRVGPPLNMHPLFTIITSVTITPC